MKNLFRQLITVVLLFLCVLGNAQDGAVDLTFNPNDTGYGNGVNDPVDAMVVQADGKIILVGQFTQYTQESRNHIVKINSDESLDNSFNPGAGANGNIKDVLVQPDGKILIGGNFTEYDHVQRKGIARINADGSLDTSFNPGSGISGENSAIYTLAIQPDGKIIAGGYFTEFNGIAKSSIIRLNADGSEDFSFSAESSNIIRKILVIPSGKIIVAGNFPRFNGIDQRYIVRLNSDGSTDNSFNVRSGTNSPVISVALQADGKIIIVGDFVLYNDVSVHGIARLNENGNNDSTFSVGFGASGVLSSIAIQSDGRILIGGDFQFFNGQVNNKLVRLNANGSLDNSFQPNLNTSFGGVQAIACYEDKIYFGGSFLSYSNISRNYIAKLNNNGSVNNTFSLGFGMGADNTVITSVVQRDGKIVIGGDFKHYNGITANTLARVNSNGSIDSTFNAGTGLNGNIFCLALQEDNKIIVAGNFNSYNNIPVRNLIRLNTDGSLDTTFNFPGVYFIFKMMVLPNDKILISGSYDSGSSTMPSYSYAMLRLNSNGTLDSTFNIFQFKSAIDFAVQADGKIVSIYGQSPSGVSSYIIGRQNSDGSVDTSFVTLPESYLQYANAIAIQADGKILFAGQNYQSPYFVGKIGRLNTDGTIDESFANVATFDNLVNQILIEPSGKIVIGGKFKTFNGFTKNNIVRLDINGNIDETFMSGSGTASYYNEVNNMNLLPENKLFIVGAFTSYNGTGRNRIARLYSSGALYTETPEVETAKVIAYKNNEGITVASLHQPLTSVQVYDVTGKLLANETVTGKMEIALPIANAKKAILLIKATLANGNTINKKIY